MSSTSSRCLSWRGAGRWRRSLSRASRAPHRLRNFVSRIPYAGQKKGAHRRRFAYRQSDRARRGQSRRCDARTARPRERLHTSHSCAPTRCSSRRARSGEPATTRKEARGQARGRNLDYFDAVVFYTNGETEMTPQQKADLLAFVRDDGKGFVAVHTATASFYALARVRRARRRLLRQPSMERIRRASHRRAARLPGDAASAARSSFCATRCINTGRRTPVRTSMSGPAR